MRRVVRKSVTAYANIQPDYPDHNYCHYLLKENNISSSYIQHFKHTASLCSCAGQFVSYLKGTNGIKGFFLDEVLRKPGFGISDQVRHKPDCTATEDG